MEFNKGLEGKKNKSAKLSALIIDGTWSCRRAGSNTSFASSRKLLLVHLSVWRRNLDTGCVLPSCAKPQKSFCGSRLILLLRPLNCEAAVRPAAADRQPQCLTPSFGPWLSARSQFLIWASSGGCCLRTVASFSFERCEITGLQCFLPQSFSPF